MTVTALCIIESKNAENAITTQYTASVNSVRTIIDKFTSTNYTAGALTLTVYLVPFGSAAGNSNLIKIKTLAAGECYVWPEVVGHTLNPGDFIATNASAATSINIRSGGRENS